MSLSFIPPMRAILSMIFSHFLGQSTRALLWAIQVRLLRFFSVMLIDNWRTRKKRDFLLRKLMLKGFDCRSPTHAGGLFAISRSYFEELGWYDDGLEIWGGEQYELSFKVWQCGGSLLWVPCSHVGHIYKKRSSVHPDILPEKLTKKGSLVHLNHRRVAETWMVTYYPPFL